MIIYVCVPLRLSMTTYSLKKMGLHTCPFLLKYHCLLIGAFKKPLQGEVSNGIEQQTIFDTTLYSSLIIIKHVRATNASLNRKLVSIINGIIFQEYLGMTVHGLCTKCKERVFFQNMIGRVYRLLTFPCWSFIFSKRFILHLDQKKKKDRKR